MKRAMEEEESPPATGSRTPKLVLVVPDGRLRLTLPAVSERTLVEVCDVTGTPLGWIVAYRPVPQEVSVRDTRPWGGSASELFPTPASACPRAANLVLWSGVKKPLPWSTKPVSCAFEDMVVNAGDRLERLKSRSTPTDTGGFWELLAAAMYMCPPPLAESEFAKRWVELEAAYYVHDFFDPMEMLSKGKNIRPNAHGHLDLSQPGVWELFGRFVAKRKVVVHNGWIVDTHSMQTVVQKTPMPQRIFMTELGETKLRCQAVFRTAMNEWLNSKAMMRAHEELFEARPLSSYDRTLLRRNGLLGPTTSMVHMGRVQIEGDILRYLFEANAVPPCMSSVLGVLAKRLAWVTRAKAPQRSYTLADVASLAVSRDHWVAYYQRLATECGQPDNTKKKAENEREAKSIYSMVSKNTERRTCIQLQRTDRIKGECVRCPAKTTGACTAQLGLSAHVPPDIEDITPRTMMRLACLRHTKQLDTVRITL